AGAVTNETRGLLRIVADTVAATAEKTRLIEDMRRANAALVENNAQLEHQYADVLETKRVKDEFLANISHELRTPLTSMIGYLSLLQEGLAGPMSDEQLRTLGEVKGSSEKMLGLIGDLLELTALTSGTAQATISAFDPRAP